jgi:threonine dehydrogenase-like Zn-dependent dehydrogenase
MYEGRTDVERGKILGHENLGEVVEVGKAVDTVMKGDKVVLPSTSPADSAPIASVALLGTA